MMTTVAPLTNFQFADKVDVHYTMASRLRNGERVPSLNTFTKVVDVFGLTDAQIREWLNAIAKGEEASGKWLRDNIFGS